MLGEALGRLVLSMVDEARGVLELAGEVGMGEGATVEDSTGAGVLWAGVVSTGVLWAGVVSTTGVSVGVELTSEIVTAGTVMVEETVVVETVV